LIKRFSKIFQIKGCEFVWKNFHKTGMGAILFKHGRQNWLIETHWLTEDGEMFSNFVDSNRTGKSLDRIIRAFNIVVTSLFYTDFETTNDE